MTFAFLGSRSFFVTLATLSLGLLLTGCGMQPIAATLPVETPLGMISGAVHGGQQPVGGAHLYVFAVGTSAYGGAATSLLQAGASTTADTTTFPGQTIYYQTTSSTASGGTFSITGDYTCTQGTQVYLYSVGGTSDGTNTNSAIGLMAGLGECPASGTLAAQVPFVVVNEVSTVAMAYALAGFAVDATHISSDAGASGNATATSAASGVKNAMATALNMISVPNGLALATTAANSNGTVPRTMIDSVANLLAACINTSGNTSSNCNTLLNTATLDGTTNGTKPTDTAGAAINIAHHPASNVGTLWTLLSGTAAAFLPALSSQPADYALAIAYTSFPALNYNSTNSVEVDSSGNIWTSGSNSFSKISPVGATLFTYGTASPGGYSYSGGDLAVGIDDTIFTVFTGLTAFTQYGTNSTGGIGHYSSTGGYLFSTYDTSCVGPLPTVGSLRLDYLNRAWWACAYYLEIHNSAGTRLIQAAQNPLSIVLDPAGDKAWMTTANSSSYPLNSVNTAGTTLTTANVGNLTRIYFMDSAGLFWNSSNQRINGSNMVSNTLSTPTGVTSSYFSALLTQDGNGTLWDVLQDTSNSNTYYCYLLSYSATGAITSPNHGYTGSVTVPAGCPTQVVPDNAGNLWLWNEYSTNVYEFVGLSTPVVTPRAVATSSNKLGKRP